MKGMLASAVCAVLFATVVQTRTEVARQPFGKMPDGSSVEVFTLKSGALEARIMTYGGILLSLKAPDRKGQSADVVLGYDNLAGYVANNNSDSPAFFGALIGRYANRIAHGKFKLEGKEYSLPLNNGANSLHGGPHGLYNVLWKAKPTADGVELTYLSKDGEAGYPGNLSVTVRYALAANALRIEYSATTDKPTVINLTNHSYFNLAGPGTTGILDHVLTLHASRFTPVDAGLIPTGELKPVASSVFDFRKPTRIGDHIEAADEQLKLGRGYDHNWVLDGKAGELKEAAELYDPSSGRVMKVQTTEPGIQFYTGNFLNDTIKGKGGRPYPRRSALCLETQHFPDSPNHPDFPSTELKPGQVFHSVTVFSFSTR
jgi:aldose 1-epimerase